MPATFTSLIEVINGNPYVRPPDKALARVFKEAGKDKGPIPVRGKLNGTAFQQSLVRYQGDWRLYINGVMAKRAGIPFKGSIMAIVGKSVKVDRIRCSSPHLSHGTRIQKGP